MSSSAISTDIEPTENVSDGAAVLVYVNENRERFATMTDDAIEKEGVLTIDHKSPHYTSIKLNWKKAVGGRAPRLHDYPISCLMPCKSAKTGFRLREIHSSGTAQLAQVVKEIPTGKVNAHLNHKSRVEHTTKHYDPMPLTVAADYLETSHTRISGMMKAGVLEVVEGYDTNGQIQDCCRKADLDNVKPCLRVPDQLKEKGFVEVKDDHIYAMCKVEEKESKVEKKGKAKKESKTKQEGKAKWERKDLAEKGPDDAKAHGRIFSPNGAEKEYAKEGLTAEELKSAARNKRIAFVTIYGFGPPVFTERALDSYVHAIANGRLPDAKTMAEINDELQALHPRWFKVKRGKKTLPSKKAREVYGILRGVKNGFIKIERIRNVFESPGKTVKKSVKVVENTYDRKRFFSILDGTAEQIKKAKELHGQGKAKAEIIAALDQDGVRGERLRLVLKGAGIIKDAPDGKKSGEIRWLEDALKTSPQLYDKLMRGDGSKEHPGGMKVFGDFRLKRAKKALGVLTDYHTLGKGVPRYTVWRLPCQKRLTEDEVQKLVDDFEAAGAPLADATSDGSGDGSTQAAGGALPSQAADLTTLSYEEKAIAVFLRDPNKSVRSIAKEIGCSHVFLLKKCPKLTALRETFVGQVPKGRKTKDGTLDATAD